MKFVKTDKVKYPYTMKLDDGGSIPIPKQQKFKGKFIREHGCSLVGVYIGLRWMGHKWTMGKILRYAKKNLKLKSKYPLTECIKLMRKVCGDNVVYHSKISAGGITKYLNNGWLIILEEKDPIHSVCLAKQGDKIKRISSGKVTTVTASEEAKKSSKSKIYKGVIICKKKRK